MRRILACLAVVTAPVVVPEVAAAGERCTAEAPDEVGVVVVVDFGDLPGASPEPSVACVSVPEGTTGSDVLEVRAQALGTSPPRYDGSGLLCAIDGLPEAGCGDRVDGGYLYWSYWQGTDDGWEHSPVGPAFRDVETTTTEGWHFVEGSGRPTDPPPRAPSHPDAVMAEFETIGETAAADGGGGSTLVGALVGAGGVVALAAGGWFVARRRRAV